MKNPTDQTRKEFEEWMTEVRVCPNFSPSIKFGDYSDWNVQTAWEAWKAATLAGQKKSEDTELMDWLDKNRVNHIYEHFKYHPSNAAREKTWRAAIRAAIATNQPKEEK